MWSCQEQVMPKQQFDEKVVCSVDAVQAVNVAFIDFGTAPHDIILSKSRNTA